MQDNTNLRIGFNLVVVPGGNEVGQVAYVDCAQGSFLCATTQQPSAHQKDLRTTTERIHLRLTRAMMLSALMVVCDRLRCCRALHCSRMQANVGGSNCNRRNSTKVSTCASLFYSTKRRMEETNLTSGDVQFNNIG